MFVEKLRKAGWKVYIQHTRIAKSSCGKDLILPKGGETVVEIISPNGLRGWGVAQCSLKDNFCKKTGYTFAIERAIIDLKPCSNVCPTPS